MNEHNLKEEFNMIDVLKNKDIPSHIKVVPTIIDTEIAKPLIGKLAFDYLVNKKFFDHPTNNINYWKDKTVPKPKIVEDKRARDTFIKNTYRDTKDNKNNLLENKPINDFVEQTEVNSKIKEQNSKLKQMIRNRRNQDKNFNKR